MDPVERVKNMVRHALVAKPDVSNQELFDRALEIAPAAVDGLSLRQFHARYRLPVVRHEMARRPRPPKKERPAPRYETSAEAGTAASVPRGRAAKKARTRQARSAAAVTSPGASAEVLRPDIRATIVDFAVELEGAQQRSDLIRVMGGIDTFVDRILNLVRRHVTGDSASATQDTADAAIEHEVETPASPPAPGETASPDSAPAVAGDDATTSATTAPGGALPAGGGETYPAPAYTAYPGGGRNAAYPAVPAGSRGADYPMPPAPAGNAAYAPQSPVPGTASSTVASPAATGSASHAALPSGVGSGNSAVTRATSPGSTPPLSLPANPALDDDTPAADSDESDTRGTSDSRVS